MENKEMFYLFILMAAIILIPNIVKGIKYQKKVMNEDEMIEKKIQQNLEVAIMLQSTMNGTANKLCDWIDNAQEEKIKFENDDYEFFQTAKVQMFQAAVLSQEDWLRKIPQIAEMSQELIKRIEKYPTKFKF